MTEFLNVIKNKKINLVRWGLFVKYTNIDNDKDHRAVKIQLLN